MGIFLLVGTPTFIFLTARKMSGGRRKEEERGGRKKEKEEQGQRMDEERRV